MKVMFILFLFLLNIYGNDNYNDCCCEILKCQNKISSDNNDNLNEKISLLKDKVNQNNQNVEDKLNNFDTKIQMKITYFDDLKKQIKDNLENFNSNLDLFYWLILIAFVLIVSLGLYKNYKIHEIKDDLEEYKKENLNPIIDTIKLTNVQIQNSVDTIQNEINNKTKTISSYENKMKELYTSTDKDKQDLEKRILKLEDNLDIMKAILASHNINVQFNENETDQVSNNDNELLE